jgi:hypothetical protein
MLSLNISLLTTRITCFNSFRKFVKRKICRIALNILVYISDLRGAQGVGRKT